MKRNGFYTVEYWCETRGLWIDVYETRSKADAIDCASEEQRREKKQFRVVYATPTAIMEVS